MGIQITGKVSGGRKKLYGDEIVARLNRMLVAQMELAKQDLETYPDEPDGVVSKGRSRRHGRRFAGWGQDFGETGKPVGRRYKTYRYGVGLKRYKGDAKYSNETMQGKYIRTGRLGRGWRLTEVRMGDKASVRLSNSVPYAVWVHGSATGEGEKDQAWMHEGRWPLMRDVVAEAMKLYNYSVDDYLTEGGFFR